MRGLERRRGFLNASVSDDAANTVILRPHLAGRGSAGRRGLRRAAAGGCGEQAEGDNRDRCGFIDAPPRTVRGDA
jgi:hypothetical protein